MASKGTAIEKMPAAAKPAAATAGESAAARAMPGELAPGGFGDWLHTALRNSPSWLVSMVFHMVVLMIMALCALPQVRDEFRQLVLSPGENEELDDIEELEDEIEEIDLEVVAPEMEVVEEVVQISPADEMESAAMHVELSDIGLEHAPHNELLATVGSWHGDGLSGRGKGRAGLAAKHGGSAGSEKAVGKALRWLANHQLPDGSWSFDHTMSPYCRGQCRNPGKLREARNGATAMGLLPFLGAGQTHKEGKYTKTVQGGLYYLTTHMKLSPKGGALNEAGGRMYSHGLASIALCEAYAMTHDKGLHAPAQAAINFICHAQDPVGGGWRYEPQQAGDTSVVGWQIMALKSGHMAYLQVPPIVVKRAFGYLDIVQADSGAQYGYTGPQAGRQATTAIGLLCRMYLGWKKDNEALKRGAEHLSKWGPSGGNMYYNYYATQVMRHWEGDLWKKWNGVMRDQLVNSQATEGHEEGSWHTGGGDHGADRGGRLYCTSMATMILEVYYRHLPIYRGQAVEESFDE